MEKSKVSLSESAQDRRGRAVDLRNRTYALVLPVLRDEPENPGLPFLALSFAFAGYHLFPRSLERVVSAAEPPGSPWGAGLQAMALLTNPNVSKRPLFRDLGKRVYPRIMRLGERYVRDGGEVSRVIALAGGDPRVNLALLYLARNVEDSMLPLLFEVFSRSNRLLRSQSVAFSVPEEEKDGRGRQAQP